jgi:hypothetical protein
MAETLTVGSIVQPAAAGGPAMRRAGKVSVAGAVLLLLASGPARAQQSAGDLATAVAGSDLHADRLGVRLAETVVGACAGGLVIGSLVAIGTAAAAPYALAGVYCGLSSAASLGRLAAGWGMHRVEDYFGW